MYLSRVEIDTKNRQKISDLSHLGAYHNWVEQSFPDEIKNKKRLRHLWRIDQVGNKNYLLVLSEEKPDLTKLERYGVPHTAETKNYEQFLNSLVEGKKYRFRLTANPTHRVINATTGKSRVVPHITILQQINWLLDRVNKHGFEIVKGKNMHPYQIIKNGEVLNQKEYIYQLDVTSRDWPLLRRKGNSRGMKLSRVTFEGILEITDLEKFKETLIKGIGREKAYGMGLLTVIPLEN